MKGKLDCQCGCKLDIAHPMLFFLESIEREIGEITINSGARCPAHNAKVGGKPNSAHTLGLAVDVSTPTPSERYAILKALFKRDVKRIGWSKDKKFIHFDIATGAVPNPTDSLKEFPQLVAWDY